MASANGAVNGSSRVKICVYCGAAAGASPAHIQAARDLGKLFAENDIELGMLASHLRTPLFNHDLC